jgi:hypothetical protein
MVSASAELPFPTKARAPAPPSIIVDELTSISPLRCLDLNGLDEIDILRELHDVWLRGLATTETDIRFEQQFEEWSVPAE